MVKWADVPDEMIDTAYHEAGHAVVGLSLRAFFTEIKIDPNDPEQGRVEFLGGFSINASGILDSCASWPLTAVPYHQNEVQRELMIHVAGHVAEDLWCGRKYADPWPELGECCEVFNRISQLLSFGFESPDPGSDLNRALLAARVLDRLGTPGDHILEAEKRADALLRSEWERVKRLARSLCRRRSHHLTAREVTKLIGYPAMWEPSA